MSGSRGWRRGKGEGVQTGGHKSRGFVPSMGDPRIVRGLIGGANEWRWRGPARDTRGDEPADIAADLLRARRGAGNAGLIRHHIGVADYEDVGIGSAPLSDRTVDHCRGCWRTHRVAREDAIKERKAARCAYASLRHEGSIGNLPRHHGGRWSERGAGQQGSAARCLPRLRNARDDRRRCADSLGATRQQRRV
jgi:hypothetical protein